MALVVGVDLRILISILFRRRGLLKIAIIKKSKHFFLKISFLTFLYLCIFLTYLLLFEGYQAESTSIFFSYIAYLPLHRISLFTYYFFQWCQAQLTSKISRQIALVNYRLTAECCILQAAFTHLFYSSTAIRLVVLGLRHAARATVQLVHTIMLRVQLIK